MRGSAVAARRVECREAVTLGGHVGKVGGGRWISRTGSGSLGDLLPNALGLVCHRSFPKSRSFRRIRKDFLLIHSIITSSKNSFLVRRMLPVCQSGFRRQSASGLDGIRILES